MENPSIKKNTLLGNDLENPWKPYNMVDQKYGGFILIFVFLYSRFHQIDDLEVFWQLWIMRYPFLYETLFSYYLQIIVIVPPNHCHNTSKSSRMNPPHLSRNRPQDLRSTPCTWAMLETCSKSALFCSPVKRFTWTQRRDVHRSKTLAQRNDFWTLGMKLTKPWKTW